MILEMFRIKKRYIVFFCIIYFFFFDSLFYNSGIMVINKFFVNSSNLFLVQIEYDTQFKYNHNIMYGEKKIINNGVTGYATLNGVVVVEAVNEIVEIGIGHVDMFNGFTTGYGADCYGCSGIVACPTLDGTSHDLINDGIYYNDSIYGKVRIIAADNTKFSCGTIMEIDNGILDPFMAIVLDTGGAMRQAWRNRGQILIDIAFSYERDDGIYNATNKIGDASFKIYRNGW